MADRVDGYDPAVTELCERALVTILGSAGFWGHSMYLVGGLAVRYLVDGMPGAAAHIGSRDVDLAVVMAIDGDGADYETLGRSLQSRPISARVGGSAPARVQLMAAACTANATAASSRSASSSSRRPSPRSSQ